MAETKQTNQNEEFNFGASKEIQDLILKTDNKALIAIIYLTSRFVKHKINLIELFENFALKDNTKIYEIKKEIEKKKQSVDEKVIRNLLQRYMETGDSDSLKKANKLKQKQNESTESLEEELQETEECYANFTEIFNKTIKNFHNKNYHIFTMRLYERRYNLCVDKFFSFNKFGIAGIRESNVCGVRDITFKEWKDIPFDELLGPNSYDYFQDESVTEERFNQLKENIRLQQAKNIAQTTNPRSAR